MLSQKGKPIAFASRTLTDTERRWAQIEKELLAVTYGLKKFHHFTYGRHVNVITDHKPLISIVKKPLSMAPKRLQNLLLRLQQYNCTLFYKRGKDIPVADCLSRAPLPIEESESAEHDYNVQSVALMSLKDKTMKEIHSATAQDEEFKKLKEVIMTGWLEKTQVHPSLLPYFPYRDDLSVQDGIVLRGDRIVIPKSLRQEMKNRVHSGHLGINSCLRRAKGLMFWPGMSSDIRQYVESCKTCAAYGRKQSPEPLQQHDVSTRPWQKVGTDIFTLQDHNYLVTVDYFSKFFKVDFLPDTLSETVVTKLKHQFARHGIPDVLISDGGPQYTSSKFEAFANKWKFNHVVSSPGNSQSNGQAEATVKIVKNIMKKSLKNSEDPYLGILNYRNTPTVGMSTSPAQRLFNRPTKTLLPITQDRLKSAENDTITEELLAKKYDISERYMHRKSLS